MELITHRSSSFLVSHLLTAKRLESGETSLSTAWGDGYGHRSSKYFFGAPFLDGRKASLFMARGIYTRHKMIAMDLNRNTHTWSTRWTWNCNNSSSPWYGNGYHNFVIADVDEDGRDEIVYGSMVIDDNGKGLSTTGYGHGDAQHVTDFDPWRKGLEFFGCLEDEPTWGFDYRNATTGEVYYKHVASDDDGRAIAGNFSDDYPGSLGRSSSWIGLMSLTTDELISDLADKITTDSNGNQVKGFEIRPIYPTDMRNSDETAYNAKRFKEVGYYYDALTGREIEINFTVDPKDYEIAELGF